MDTLHEELHAFLCPSQAQLAECLSERKMLRTKAAGKNKARILCLVHFYPQLLEIARELHEYE
jgi:hypothetical protein